MIGGGLSKLRNRNFFIKAIIILLLLIVLYFIVFFIYNNINNSNEDDEWNLVDDSPKYDSGSLYESSTVPALNKLFINTNFIEQVKLNRLAYLYGFSNDGNYLASIYYDDKTQAGYIINIDNISTGESTFSLFIPDNKYILDSKEFSTAKELVEKAYKINIPPSKLDWKDTFVYENNKDTWYFNEENNEGYARFNISTSISNENWSILLNNQSYYPVYTEVFSSPGKPEWLTFVFYFEQFQNGISNYKTIFIDLNKLTDKNSIDGKVKEADRWLYGNFKFVYDQWEKCNKKGFIAVASDDEVIKQEGNFFELVDQWIYLDTTGKMQWYGNSEGIYNSKGLPVQLAERGYFYKLKLTEYPNKGLVYYTIDIFDKADNNFIKTVEFLWDTEAQNMIPIPFKDVVL